MKSTVKTLIVILILAGVVLTSGAVEASEFPERPITFIIPFDAGTSADQSGRLLAAQAEEHLGVDIRVENYPGGIGAVGFSEIMESNPDGYTIGQVTVNLPLLHEVTETLDFGHHDLEPIALYTQDWATLVVDYDARWQDLGEFIEFGQENPGMLTMGSGAAGSLGYLVGQTIQLYGDFDATEVPDPGGGAGGVVATAGGHIDSAIGSPLEAQSQIEAGEVRALAVTSPERLGLEGFEDVPTLKEEGLDVYIGNTRTVYAPPETPTEKIEILADAFRKAIESEEFQEFSEDTGANAVFAPPEEVNQIYDEQLEILIEAYEFAQED